jgi:hypothetical protein
MYAMLVKSFKSLFTKFARQRTKKNGQTATWAFTLSEEEAQSLLADIG